MRCFLYLYWIKEDADEVKIMYGTDWLALILLLAIVMLLFLLFNAVMRK